MVLPKNFGLVMVLIIGIVLGSSPMAQSVVLLGFDFGAFLNKIFGNQRLGTMPTSTPPVQLPFLAPAPTPVVPAPAPVAPAPGPSVSRKSSSSPFFSSTPSAPGLVVGFYDDKCTTDIEVLIESLLVVELKNDSTIFPALLRLQFHDCFVKGCDSSLLIDGPTTEKTAGPNQTVRGYEVIERLKKAIEAVCPGVVSCSDIVAISVKVLIKLGGGLDYPVETGRRDGLVSSATDVTLPNPDMTVAQVMTIFTPKNFTLEEMVVLLGYHAVGKAHCNNFQNRLFQGTSTFDSQIDPTLLSQLRQLCPQGALTNNEALLNQDPTNNNTLNNGFYNQLIGNRGVLALDQLLARDSTTSTIVTALAQNRTLFDIRTAQVMRKLQAVEVLTGTSGEIRKVCNKIN